MELPPYYKSIKRKYRYRYKKNEPLVIKVKDKAWSLLSDYVRVRDFNKYGTCISCGKRADCWKDLQGGHYVNAGSGGAELSFDLQNVNAQCGKCNMGGMDVGASYKEELDRRLGEGTADKLRARKFLTSNADTQFFINKMEEIYNLLTKEEKRELNLK